MTEQLALRPEEMVREMLLMGLRLTEGVSEDRFLARTGRTLESAIDADALRQALEEGYVTWFDGKLTATQAGRRRLDALLPYCMN